MEEGDLVETKLVATEALGEVEEDLNIIVVLVVQEQVGKEMMAVMLEGVEVTSAVEAVVEPTRWEDEVAPPVALLINRFLMGVKGRRRA